MGVGEEQEEELLEGRKQCEAMVPGVQIRPYAEVDAASVADLWSAVFPDPAPRNMPEIMIQKKLALQRELFFVAVIDGSVVGTAMGTSPT